MASSTILDVMPREDLKVLAEGVRSGDPKAVALLEACFELELKDPVIGTEQASPEMILASFERALNLDQESQAANKTVSFSPTPSLEQEFAAIQAQQAIQAQR
jgi:hypothetical protein